jgi:hypothetical protein
MSANEIYRIVFEHIVDSPNYRFVCARVETSGRTRLFKIYSDGTVHTYEGGCFVELPRHLGTRIRLALGAAQGIPTFYSKSLN